METQVHTVAVTLDWGLLAAVSKLDRFDASWSSIERREGQSLKQLKAIATVRSVGASTWPFFPIQRTWTAVVDRAFSAEWFRCR